MKQWSFFRSVLFSTTLFSMSCFANWIQDLGVEYEKVSMDDARLPTLQQAIVRGNLHVNTGLREAEFAHGLLAANDAQLAQIYSRLLARNKAVKSIEKLHELLNRHETEFNIHSFIASRGKPGCVRSYDALAMGFPGIKRVKASLGFLSQGTVPWDEASKSIAQNLYRIHTKSAKEQLKAFAELAQLKIDQTTLRDLDPDEYESRIFAVADQMTQIIESHPSGQVQDAAMQSLVRFTSRNTRSYQSGLLGHMAPMLYKRIAENSRLPKPIRQKAWDELFKSPTMARAPKTELFPVEQIVELHKTEEPPVSRVRAR